ncbi:MAG: hypothetical protein RIT10_308 [Bacteroidota bacterium]
MRLVIVLFTFLFTIVSLAPNMRGGEYFKFTEVIAHYNNHQKSETAYSSFFTFLKEHYSKDHKPNKDEKNLPFKTLTANSFHLIHQDCSILKIEDLIIIPIIKKEHFNYKKSFYQQKLFAIWNPPKTC